MDIVIDKIKLSQEILEIVEKTNEPMSLDEIMEKFNPPFPFQVRKVTDDCSGHIFTIAHVYTYNKGDIVTYANCPVNWRRIHSGRVYRSLECTHCLGLSTEAYAWLPDTKSWVLV